MITYFLIYFAVMALLFFIVSFMARPKFGLIIIFLNLIFLSFVYFSIIKIAGAPFPTQYNFPFFKMEQFNASNVGLVLEGYITDDLIYLLIKDNEFGVRLYEFKNTPKFLAEIKAAYKERNGWGFAIKTDTNYEGDTEAHVPMGQFQNNTNIPKNYSEDSEGVRDVEVK